MWTEIGTAAAVVACVIQALVWLEIKPPRLRELTQKHRALIFTLIFPVLMTGVGIGLIVFNMRAGILSWWLYVEACWGPIFVWLVFFRDLPLEGRFRKLLRNAVLLAPLVLLLGWLGRVDNALATGAFDTSKPSLDKWGILGFSSFQIFLIGFTFGFLLVNMIFSNRIQEIRDRFRDHLRDHERKQTELNLMPEGDSSGRRPRKAKKTKQN